MLFSCNFFQFQKVHILSEWWEEQKTKQVTGYAFSLSESTYALEIVLGSMFNGHSVSMLLRIKWQVFTIELRKIVTMNSKQYTELRNMEATSNVCTTLCCRRSTILIKSQDVCAFNWIETYKCSPSVHSHSAHICVSYSCCCCLFHYAFAIQFGDTFFIFPFLAKSSHICFVK